MNKRAFVVLLAALAGGCSASCGNSIVATTAAPGGGARAVLFQRDCGATTGASSQVSVLQADDAAAGAGNAFVADTDHGSARAAPWGGPWVELRWLGPQSLLVRYDAKARVLAQNDSAAAIAIRYEAVER